MSYIAFELDALNVVPDVAAACGLPAGDVAYGLLKLWAWCFREKTDLATGIHLAGFFAGRSAAAQALEAFGFLRAEGASWRVRGAARYLRIAEARRKGGLASVKNLIPGGPKPAQTGPDPAENPAENPAERQPSASRAPAETHPRLELGSFTEHRAPNIKRSADPKTEVQTDPPLTVEPTTEARPNPKPTLVEPEAPKKPRDSDLLCAAFENLLGTPYAWQGTKDGAALAALLKDFSIDQILERWRAGLKASASEWASCRTVAQLRMKFNDLAKPTQPAQPAFVSREHKPSKHYR